ncbi:MAG: decaprenyl-phosphate phosphoribosyltransferase [Acidimicrobiales bacterium]
MRAQATPLDEPTAAGAPKEATQRRPLWKALVAAARPQQWPKNVLVFAAPLAAVVVGRPVSFSRTAAAAALFCVASSGTYLVNDALDADADRLHPVKRFRPVASGELGIRAALVLGVVMLAVASAAAVMLAGLALGAVVIGYGSITLLYSAKLKQVPVVELFCISSGFVLRTVAGGVAARIPISLWFLVLASSGSLLIASGKRTAELLTLGSTGASHRAALGWYTPRFLAVIRRGMAAITIGAYCFWAVGRWGTIDDRVHDGPVLLGSMLPFACAVIYLEYELAHGRGGAPEELALHSRVLQGLGAAWILTLVMAVAT